MIIENAEHQRNGIVVVPPAGKDCMSCRESMVPPFPLLPGVEPKSSDLEPLLYDIEIRGFGNCYEHNSLSATFLSLIELFSGDPPSWSPPSCP